MEGITLSEIERDGDWLAGWCDEDGWAPVDVWGRACRDYQKDKGYQNGYDGKQGDGEKGDGKKGDGKKGEKGKKGDGKKGGCTRCEKGKKSGWSAPASSSGAAPASSVSDTAGAAAKRGPDDGKVVEKRGKKPIPNLDNIDESKKHQYRKCIGCSMFDHWRVMESVKEEGFEGLYGEWKYTCLPCYCTSHGVTPAEGRRAIKQPRTAAGIHRCIEYQYARKHILEDWKFLFVGDGGDNDGVDEDSGTAADSVSPGVHYDETNKGTIAYSSESQKKKMIFKAAVVKRASMSKILAPMARILALKALDMEEP